MAQHEDILSDLPAPNDAEPRNLRQDIADELTDHLQSAALRESLLQTHPEKVEKRILTRFGNPRKIARQLWFDAMKEKLMTQKITLVLVSIVAVASATACGLMWSLARDFQAVAAEAQAASAKLLSQGQDANAELLKQNQEMMAQLAMLARRKDETPASLDWNPLKIRVVKNDENKTPAEGYQVYVTGHHISETADSGVQIKTHKSGVADFGLVRPGSFQGIVTTPWGESGQIGIYVQPGKGYENEIIAPAAPPEPIQVKPVVKWPKEFEGLDVAVVVRVYRKDATELDGNTWSGGGGGYLLLRPDGRFAVYDNIIEANSNGYSSEGLLEGIYDRVYFSGPGKESRDAFSWHGREPTLGTLSIVQLAKDADFPGEGDSLNQLSPSSYLSRYESQYPAVQIQRGDDAKSLMVESLPDGGQQWTISPTLQDILVTKTMLAPEQFPKLPADLAVPTAIKFFLADADFSNDLSEEELKDSQFSREFQLGFEEFPVALKPFVEACVESLKRSRGSGRNGRGS